MGRKAFNWDEYNKIKRKIIDSGVIIEFEHIFVKGKRSRMGIIEAAKINTDRMLNVGDSKSIRLWSF